MITGYILVLVVTVLIGGWSIPLGIVLDLDPLGVYLAAVGGSALVMLLVLSKGSAVMDRYFPNAEEKTGNSRAGELLDRWGVPGLAVVGSSLLGPAITLTAALVFGVDERRFGVWYLTSTIVAMGLLTLFWDAVLS